MKNYKKRFIYTIVVSFIVVFSTTFAILMTLERNDYRNYLQGEYSKNMYQLINSVQNIRTNLAKSAVVNSKEQSIMVFEEIFRYSASASNELNSLPLGIQNTEGTSKFLSQVGDFCYSLARNISEGRKLSDDDYEKIDLLEVQSYELESRLNNVLGDINQKKVKWGEIRKKTAGVLAKSDSNIKISDKFISIQKQIAQYPALIYDGPFSDNEIEIKPKVNSLKVITKEQAKNIVKNLFDDNEISKIQETVQDKNTKIDSYRFNITLNNSKENSIVCEITKHGGRILYLLNGRNIGKPKINIKKADEISKKYLEKLGYKNMQSTYTLKYENTAVISYVYKQNNIFIYPDQIKLKIALDDGEIIGIESEKYLVSHQESRKNLNVKITQQDAAKKVSNKLEVNAIRLCVIPTETDKEVFCYEFVGKYKDNNFIVYINAVNGYEQKIVQIINTPNGELII